MIGYKTPQAAAPSIGDSVNLNDSTFKSYRHFGVRIKFSFGKLYCVFPLRSPIYRQRGLAAMQSIQAYSFPLLAIHCSIDGALQIDKQFLRK